MERLFIRQPAKVLRILAFPEMRITGYWHVIDPAPKRRGSTVLWRELPAWHKVTMAIGVGLIERASDDRLYNTYVVCMPDGQETYPPQAARL
jgi:predicted amidohydrolase